MDGGFIESQAKAFTAEQHRNIIKWENKLTNQTDCAMTITGAAKVIDWFRFVPPSSPSSLPPGVLSCQLFCCIWFPYLLMASWKSIVSAAESRRCYEDMLTWRFWYTRVATKGKISAKLHVIGPLLKLFSYIPCRNIHLMSWTGLWILVFVWVFGKNTSNFTSNFRSIYVGSLEWPFSKNTVTFGFVC